MIGHRVRAALERKAAKPAAAGPPRRRFTPKHLLPAEPMPTASACVRCGALRQANAEGKLPPHRCVDLL